MLSVLTFSVTYLLLYLVDITHYVNFDYCIVYFYATHNFENVIWRPALPCVDCDATNKHQFMFLFTRLNLLDFIVGTRNRYRSRVANML
jgi:hypothetical protein